MGIDIILSYVHAESLLYALAGLCTIWWLALWAVHFIAIAYAKHKLHRRSNVPRIRLKSECTPLQQLETDNAGVDAQVTTEISSPTLAERYPPVSIIKPLCGVDPNLAINLETFFTMNYPCYELLFCVHTHDDPAVYIINSLLAKFPHVDARLFTGGENVGVNPKINNMMPAYRAAKYQLLLVSDAGIMMRPDALYDMVEAMHPDVAIVTQMPFTNDAGRTGFAAALEKVFFGTMHARMYLSADLFRIVCSTGMSSLMRRCALEQVGGMEAFGAYLAEDYFFAYQFVQNGWRCAVASQPAMQNHVPELTRFMDRLCRWTKLRHAMMPQTIILEPLQDCMPVGAIAAWAVSFILGWNALILLLVHILAWMLLDYVMLRIVQNAALPFGKYEYVIVWLYREFLALPLAIKALLQPTITWRTGDYRLEWGGRARRLTAYTHENLSAKPLPPAPASTPEPPDVRHSSLHVENEQMSTHCTYTPSSSSSSTNVDTFSCAHTAGAAIAAAPATAVLVT